MPLIVNDVVEVTIKLSMEGAFSRNITHWRCDRPITGNSQSVAERVLGAFQDEIVPFLSTSLVVDGADFVDLDTEDGDDGSIPPVTGKPDNGSASAAALPPNTGILVRKHVEGGRTSRSGRMTIMGVAEGEVGNRGDLTSSALTGWNDAVDAFLDAANRTANGDSGITMCVVRRGDPPGIPTASFDVLDLSVSAIMGTQRLRMRR